ncbi:glycosyltransferase family 4 protein [Methanomicrobium antiquum]|uniref:Glycosyltransferase family 4 protein n=1 Tax=Methanomicrobium antiquum TaxID=487686 RepID=A0AAF0FT14_9EURY|nr:glycosyltransferase family 4 protein [Methanomicrobium antiquum]WFN37401.1 glycosyltransferase family 4 protein [Methanomicrobium antiquum]
MKKGIINHPNTINITPLNNLLKILTMINCDIHCIFGIYEFQHHEKNQNITCEVIYNKQYNNYFFRILNYFNLQIKLIKAILKQKKDIDVFIFFIGGDTLLLPIICAKLFGKKVILLLAGSSIKTHHTNQDKLTVMLKIIRKPCLFFADNILIYSKLLIQDYQLESYQHKIIIAGEHFIDFNIFNIITPLNKRPFLIGYIGRLSEEKGILNFILALKILLRENDGLNILICGDGQLKESIEIYITESGLTERVQISGWISHNEIPKYLNQLRLLILPSYTEGLPNIILEAMACGTPVLATPVGAIPDIINNGINGFIMDNNSPKCIAESVNRVLKISNLEEIVKNGNIFVYENYSFEKTLYQWSNIIKHII